jgi:hypothetical protein
MESQDQVASCVCARQLFIPSFILYVVLSARIPEAETPPHTQFRLITKSIQGFMMFKRFENPTCQIQEKYTHPMYPIHDLYYSNFHILSDLASLDQR